MSQQQDCPQEWKDAFGEMIVLARSIRHKMHLSETKQEYAKKIREIGARAGLTRQEAAYYGIRTWMMVSQETHT